MKQANLILASKEVLGTLRRTAAARIKADGTDCSHLMHEIGATDEDNYDEQLKVAMSIVDVIPMPSDIQTPNFKELCLVSQQSIKVVATKFSKQTVKDAIKYIAREVSSNPADFGNSSTINNVISEELMEVNTQLIQNQVHQEAMINQLMATVNAMSASTPHKSTTKYCHLHGPNNSHNGTECKKMGSPGFTILGKAITQAMINNRVPGKVVDGVTGKK